MKKLIFILAILSTFIFSGCASLKTEKPLKEIKFSCNTRFPVEFYIYSENFTSEVFSLQNGESVIIDNLENTTGPYSIKFKYEAENGYHEKLLPEFDSTSQSYEIQIIDDSYGKIYQVLLWMKTK